MSTDTWKQIAEANGIDCTLRRVEITCVREHVGIPGYDFMPFGWCGACETCLSIEVPIVCESCSFDDKYDMREPTKWPCVIEKRRAEKEYYAEVYAKRKADLDAIRNRSN